MLPTRLSLGCCQGRLVNAPCLMEERNIRGCFRREVLPATIPAQTPRKKGNERGAAGSACATYIFITAQIPINKARSRFASRTSGSEEPKHVVFLLNSNTGSSWGGIRYFFSCVLEQ